MGELHYLSSITYSRVMRNVFVSSDKMKLLIDTNFMTRNLTISSHKIRIKLTRTQDLGPL